MAPFAILASFMLVPVLLAHGLLTLFWAFCLKNAGRYSFSRLALFGCLSGAMLFGVVSIWNLSGHQELYSSGNVMVASGRLTATAYLAVLLASGVGAIWGALASLAFHGLSRPSKSAESHKT